MAEFQWSHREKQYGSPWSPTFYKVGARFKGVAMLSIICYGHLIMVCAHAFFFLQENNNYNVKNHLCVSDIICLIPLLRQ